MTPRNLFVMVVLMLFSGPLFAEPTQESLQRRRSLLNLHQIGGMTTLALWLATNIEGEKALKSMYRRSDESARMLLLTRPEYAVGDPLYFAALRQPDRRSIAADYFLAKDPQRNAPLYFALKQSEEWEARRAGSLHRSLAMATFAAYTVTAGAAFLAPEGVNYKREGYDSVFFHKAMIPVHLASMLVLARLGSQVEHREGAAYEMQRAGWTGFGALSIAFLTITF